MNAQNALEDSPGHMHRHHLKHCIKRVAFCCNFMRTSWVSRCKCWGREQHCKIFFGICPLKDKKPPHIKLQYNSTGGRNCNMTQSLNLWQIDYVIIWIKTEYYWRVNSDRHVILTSNASCVRDHITQCTIMNCGRAQNVSGSFNRKLHFTSQF